MARHTHAHRRGCRTLPARYLPDYVEQGNRTTHRRSGILPQPAPISGQYSRGDCNSRPHPRETPRSISHAYAVSIEAAQKNIQIVNPYFVPTKSIRKAIKKALKKGTEVEIMIPAVSDIPFTPEASFYIAHKLMKRGAKIYLFKDGFHHSKVMMVDSTFCTVGTANLNSRSLRYDYETNAFIFDPSTTNQLNSMFERDKKNSTLLTPEMWKKRSGWKKFLGWVGNLLTPFL